MNTPDWLPPKDTHTIPAAQSVCFSANLLFPLQFSRVWWIVYFWHRSVLINKHLPAAGAPLQCHRPGLTQTCISTKKIFYDTEIPDPSSHLWLLLCTSREAEAWCASLCWDFQAPRADQNNPHTLISGASTRHLTSATSWPSKVYLSG